MLDGLHLVHQGGLLHRDIKPLNIYLAMRPRPTPILLDFGAARMAVSEKSRHLSVIWTDGYAPLEQYSSKGKQGPWTDIYACGATLYHLVTGTIPPPAPERLEHDSLVPLRRLDARLSKSFCGAVERALAIDSAARPQSVHSFRELLSGRAPPVRQRTPSAPEAAGGNDGQFIGCPHCKARNRMLRPTPGGPRPSGRPHCGKCGSPLDA